MEKRKITADGTPAIVQNSEEPRGSLKVPLVDLVTGAKQTVSYNRIGEGNRETVETLKFAIPAGIRDGGTVRLRGQRMRGSPCTEGSVRGRVGPCDA